MKSVFSLSLRLGLATALVLPQSLWAAQVVGEGVALPGSVETVVGPAALIEETELNNPGNNFAPTEEVKISASVDGGADRATLLPQAAAIAPVAEKAVAVKLSAEPKQQAQLNSIENVRAMATAAASRGHSGVANPTASHFDGNKVGQEGGGEDDEAAPEGGLNLNPTPITSGPLDLSFRREAKKGLKNSKVFTTVHIIKGWGSQRYWEQYQEGGKVRIVVSRKSVVRSQVESALTKEIKDVTKNDLSGYYSDRVLAAHDIRWLRKKLEKEFAAISTKPITPHSKVRVIRFIPFKAAMALQKKEREAPVPPAAPRNAISIPEKLIAMHQFLPKLIVLDLRLFQGPVPVELVNDMGKLMKAGVHFALISDKPAKGPGSIEELLAHGLGDEKHDHYDNLVRYKLAVVSEDGNSIMAYKGNFLESLPVARFKRMDMELLKLAGHKLGVSEMEARSSTRLVMTLPEGANQEQFVENYKNNLTRLGIAENRYYLTVGMSQGRLQVIVRPNALEKAIENLISGLENHDGLYVNSSDMLVISKDEKMLNATQGAVQPIKYAPELGGEELAEMSLAAALGEYRETKPGDLASSASMIKSVIEGDGYGSAKESVNMLIGHVIHSAFNWAILTRRNTGVFPALDQVLHEALGRWSRDIAQEKRNILPGSGKSQSDFREDMKTRLAGMYGYVAQQIQKYPIIFGTEIPNVLVIPRYARGGLPFYRDMFRMTYDIMLGRMTPQGLEVVILDLKTGASQDNTHLSKDIQYLLYDMSAQAMRVLPVPYNVTGEMTKVAQAGVSFIYPTGIYQPQISDKERLAFQIKTLPNANNRLRREFNMPIPKAPVLGKKSAGKSRTLSGVASKRKNTKAKKTKKKSAKNLQRKA